jgi:hypothetical protein
MPEMFSKASFEALIKAAEKAETMGIKLKDDRVIYVRRERFRIVPAGFWMKPRVGFYGNVFYVDFLRWSVSYVFGRRV